MRFHRGVLGGESGDSIWLLRPEAIRPKGRIFVLGEMALVMLFVWLTIVYGGLAARAFKGPGDERLQADPCARCHRDACSIGGDHRSGICPRAGQTAPDYAFFAWILIVAGAVAVERLNINEPAGFRMLAIIGDLIYGMKAIVSIEVQVHGARPLSLGCWLAFRHALARNAAGSIRSSGRRHRCRKPVNFFWVDSPGC